MSKDFVGEVGSFWATFEDIRRMQEMESCPFAPYRVY